MNTNPKYAEFDLPADGNMEASFMLASEAAFNAERRWMLEVVRRKLPETYTRYAAVTHVLGFEHDGIRRALVEAMAAKGYYTRHYENGLLEFCRGKKVLASFRVVSVRID